MKNYSCITWHWFFTCFWFSLFINTSTDADGKDSKFQNPITLYGKEIEFDVYRNGEKVGFHKVSFSGQANRLKVTSKFVLEVKILFITAYKFSYRSQSIWSDGVLSEINVIVDDNGEAFSLKGSRIGDNMLITKGSKNYQTNTPLFPTNHWNAEVLNQKVVLNTLTGELNKVQIIRGEKTKKPSERGQIEAQHFSYTGDLDTQVWYDLKGRWVGMEFLGRDGSKITYHCQRCLGSAPLNQKSGG